MIPENWRQEWKPSKKEGFYYRGKPLFWWINKAQAEKVFDELDMFRIIEGLEYGDPVTQCVSIGVLSNIAPYNIMFRYLLDELAISDDIAVRTHARNAIFRINGQQIKPAKTTGNGHLPIIKQNATVKTKATLPPPTRKQLPTPHSKK